MVCGRDDDQIVLAAGVPRTGFLMPREGGGTGSRVSAPTPPRQSTAARSIGGLTSGIADVDVRDR